MFSIQDSLDYRRMRAEGTSDSYWNAGYLQGIPISSNLKSITTTGKSLTYNGTEWTSSFTTEIGGLPINTTIPINDGQVLTYNGTSTSWTNEYPRNLRGTPVSSILPTSGQILGYNGINWIPVNTTGTPGPAGTVAFGNTIVVDSKLGNDLSGSVDGNAVKTIQTAISKVNALSPARPITIWVMPGTYELSGDLNAQGGITIPDNTTLRGVTLQGCIIQRTENVSSNTTLITMGVNSRLEDFTLNLSSSSNVELKAVYFPNQTPTSAKVRVCLINVTSTVGSLTNIVCGIFSDGSTSNPNPDVVRSTNAVQRSTTNVTASSGGGIVRGWYFTGALQFSVRDTVIFANGENSIGVETTNKSSFIIIKTSTIAGKLYDLKQPSGLTVQNSGIQLCATDLVNANADANGFTVNIESTNLYFSVTGNIGNATHYLFPGTSSFGSLSHAPLGIPFSQNIICFGGILTGVSDAMSGSATIKLYNSTSATSLSPGTPPVTLTPFATLTANNTNKVVIFNNKSSTFKKSTNFLHVELITSDNIGNSVRGLLLGLSLY